MRGFQVWINLPAANKMDNPEYQEYSSAAFPVVETADYTAKVLIGRFADKVSPIEDAITQVIYLDVQVKAGKHFQYTLPSENNSLLYVFEGSGQLNGQNVPVHTLFVPGSDNNTLEVVAGAQGVRFVMMSGKPVNEPIVQYGPFVMNTKEEIEQAMRDYQSNRLVRDRAWIKRDQ